MFKSNQINYFIIFRCPLLTVSRRNTARATLRKKHAIKFTIIAVVLCFRCPSRIHQASQRLSGHGKVKGHPGMRGQQARRRGDVVP